MQRRRARLHSIDPNIRENRTICYPRAVKVGRELTTGLIQIKPPLLLRGVKGVLTDGWGVLYSHKPMKLLRKKIDNNRKKREAEAE